MAPTTSAGERAPAEIDKSTETTPADAEEQALRDEFDSLNPCRVCDAHQHEGPEGTAWHGDHTTAKHCWRCGFRPGQSVAPAVTLGRQGIDPSTLTKAFAELRSSVVADVLEGLRAAGVVPSPEVEEAAADATRSAIDGRVDPPAPGS